MFAAVMVLAGAGGAHEFRPGILDVTALGGGRYEVGWVPAPGGERARPVFPERCAWGGEPRVLDCGARGLGGERITVVDMAPLRDEVLVRLHLQGGVEQTAMLSAGQPSLLVPGSGGQNTEPENTTSPARSVPATILAYALAGAAHLATGPDHVLFLMGLLFLVRGAQHPDSVPPRWPRALFWAITAFTAAHSLSLALQVLGAVRLPPAPVEAAIALSVLFLARELLRPPGRATLAQRRPYVVTFAFGLLHGLGFAGGLAALHVPRAEVPAALFGFNVGLEIAQVGLVLAALAVGLALRPLAARLPVWTRRAPAYSLGAAAAFWLFTRTAAFWY